MTASRSKTTVRAAVDAELRKLKATDTVEGRQAQQLASLIDSMRSARDAASTHRELREVLNVIREQAKAADKQTSVEKIRAAREKRRKAVIRLDDERERRRTS